MPVAVAARQPDAHARAWYGTAAAVALMGEEQRQIAPLVARCRGVRGLYLRPDPVVPAALAGHLLQQVVSLARMGDQWRGDLAMPLDAFALQRDAVDLVVALHALGDAPSRPALLLEMERVLSPEGTLLVVELNPWSLYRWRWMRRGPHALSAGDCSAALRAGGFEPMARYAVGPLLPTAAAAQTAPLGRYFPNNVLRAGYVLLARKRSATATPVRPRTRMQMQPGMLSG